jgi:hypothetical protein
VSGLTASILTPTAYNESVIGNLGGADLELSALIGCFGGASGVVPQPVCPGGDCVWPLYHSLALCTQCVNMTKNVSTSGDRYRVNFTEIIDDRNSRNITSDLQQTFVTTYSFPNSRPVTGSVQLDLTGSGDVQYSVYYPRRIVWPLNIDGTPNSLWTYSWARNTYAGIDGPLLAMGYLDMDLSDDASSLELKQALECSLTPCVREFDSKMVGGTLISHVVATNYGNVSINPDGPYPTAGWTATVNATNYTVIDKGIGNVQGWAAILIQSLRVAMEGNTTYIVSANCQGSNCQLYPATGYSMTGGPWSSSAQQAVDGTNNFTQIVEGVATALTGRFQTLSNSSVEGQVLQTLTFVDVRWGWILYPLVLVLMGMGTLLATVLQTKRAGFAVWKASTMPLLFRNDVVGQTPGESTLIGATSGHQTPNRVSQLDQSAQQAQALLLRDDDEGIWFLKGKR